MENFSFLDTLIGIVGGAFLSLIAWYFKTHVGNKVIFEKISESSLISLSDKVGSELSLIYKEKKINQLYFYEFHIYNDGYIDISNFQIKITFTGDSNFSLFKLRGELLPEDIIVGGNLIDDNSTELKISKPYLNMKKKNKNEVINLQFFSDSKLTNRAAGGGVGWFVGSKEKSTSKKLSDFIELLMFYFGAIILFIFAYFLADAPLDKYISLAFLVSFVIFGVIGILPVWFISRKREKPK